MALNSTTKQAIEAFVDGIGTANPVSLDVDNLEFNRTISKKFAKMLSGVKKKQVTLANTDYTLTKEGAVSMVEMFDEGESLAPSYNESGALDINTDVNQPTVVLGGTFVSKATNIVDGNEVPVASSQRVKGKTVALYDATVAKNAAVFVEAYGPVNVEGCTVDNRDGKVSKGTAGCNQDGPFNVSGGNPTSVSIKNMKYWASNADGSNALYNGLQLFCNNATKSIVVEDCQFLGTFTNNGINVYGCASNAVITVKNCYFQKVSNVLRLSNNTNATNVTINFENCVIDSWEGDTATSDNKNDWAGFCICQDYTSGVKSGNKCVNTPEAKEQSTLNANTNNLFAPNKIKINIKNCVGPNGPIQLAEGKTVADGAYCQTGLADQLCYVIRDCATPYLLPYDPACYPTIKVEYTAAPTVQKASIPTE